MAWQGDKVWVIYWGRCLEHNSSKSEVLNCSLETAEWNTTPLAVFVFSHSPVIFIKLRAGRWFKLQPTGNSRRTLGYYGKKDALIAACVSQTGQHKAKSIGCCLINSDFTLVEKFCMEEAAQKREISTLRSFQNSASYSWPSAALSVSRTWGMGWE